ncbi:MAG: hypothetical protein HKO54_05985 [Flavobacteriaceae bacterium]|nr:hypothetical protein [Flavobacteriaceae bacterium]
MLLIHTQTTTRLDYVFKHICTRILGVKVEFTTVIESFIAHTGPKISYGKQPIGNELFFQSFGLLEESGIEDLEIQVEKWEDGIGFFPVSDNSALPYDIFSAAFYLLSRYEEYLPHLKDELGRFPAESSLACQAGFLNRPVVDEWAYEFQKVLLEQFPEMEFISRRLKIHHLVDASQPFAYSQKGFLRNFAGYFQDLSKFRIKNILQRTRVLIKLRKDPFDTFAWMVNSARNTNHRLSVFFRLGEAYTFMEGLNAKREKFRLLVKFVSDYAEVGLVFSYHSLKNNEMMKAEKKRMEELTRRSLGSSMFDKFIIDLPTHYRNLLELEVGKDITMLYEGHLGFRASTCTPFLFYDLDYEIKTPLIVHPVAGTTLTKKKRTRSELESEVEQLFNSVQQVGGTFSLLFNNRDFQAKSVFWPRIFSDNTILPIS